MNGSRLVCEMFTIELNADPHYARQNERTHEDDKNLRAPSALPGFYRWNFLFHICSFEGLLAFAGFRWCNVYAKRWFLY
jgi:hypothetical protein